MARPRKGKELNASRQIGVRVSEDVREALDALADANGHSLTEEIRLALEKHVGRAAPKVARNR